MTFAAEPRKAPAKPPAKSAPPVTAKTVPGGSLPLAAAEMRDAIIAAAVSGDIEELRTPLAWNELPPELADHKVPDPIAFLKEQSADSGGLEILAVLLDLLDQPFAISPVGRDLENNRVYVWPALAVKPLGEITAAEKVQLLRIVPPRDVPAMIAGGRYTGWQIAIGADGTWHSFRRRP